jgi:pyruvate dehydrogenase E1 component beta subunit
MRKLNIIQALNEALHQEFEANPNLVSFGEDCGHFGGVFRVTSGLHKKFGEGRVFDTPLSEAGIAGFAIGMAQRGMKPVCEIQFADYIYPAFDQIVNEMAKMRYRTAGQYTSSFVIRTPYGGGIHGGLYHSQSPEALFLHTPGIHVVFPSDPYEAKGLLTSAMRSQDPVIFFEPKRIYRASKSNVPEESYTIPLGKADVARTGKDITLIGWGAQHHQNMQAADELMQEYGIDVEVINLRSLNPLDEATLYASVHKTKRCVIAHEAPITAGFGAEIAALISKECFLSLEAPVQRCCGLDIPFPHTLEKYYLPDSYRIKPVIIETINY